MSHKRARQRAELLTGVLQECSQSILLPARLRQRGRGENRGDLETLHTLCASAFERPRKHCPVSWPVHYLSGSQKPEKKPGSAELPENLLSDCPRTKVWVRSTVPDRSPLYKNTC